MVLVARASVKIRRWCWVECGHLTSETNRWRGVWMRSHRKEEIYKWEFPDVLFHDESERIYEVKWQNIWPSARWYTCSIRIVIGPEYRGQCLVECDHHDRRARLEWSHYLATVDCEFTLDSCKQLMMKAMHGCMCGSNDSATEVHSGCYVADSFRMCWFRTIWTHLLRTYWSVQRTIVVGFNVWFHEKSERIGRTWTTRRRRCMVECDHHDRRAAPYWSHFLAST